ncbi:MAG TPA: hypothetical protein VN924_01445 [Bryobacteraceae bacterium]|jgi:hypothetical protein|nr:hypothetical protein [Bryobacteraceae bacterium]
MSILFRSAQKLRLDAPQIFATAADYAANPLIQIAMRGSPRGPPDERKYLYQGNVATATDAAGKWKQYTNDAFGK